MTGKRPARQPIESDAYMEQQFGTRDALFALWNPDGQSVTLSLGDSSIIMASDQTRSRLTEVHSVIHTLLRAEHGDALRRLRDMSSLMTAFTGLRSLTLASELLWETPMRAWQDILVSARNQVTEFTGDFTSTHASEARTGATSMYEAIRHNLVGDKRETILECVAGTASALSWRARLGLGGFGAVVFTCALKNTSNRTLNELEAEHAALLLTMGRSQAVTHRDGHLIMDD